MSMKQAIPELSFDPNPSIFMVRHMQTLPKSLSITRQAVQDIWHVVCHTDKKEIFGLLGMTKDGLICRVQYLEDFNEEKLKHVANQWMKDAVFVQGNIQSTPLDKNDINKLQPMIASDAWLSLVLNMDTQGCLKSSLYALQENEYVELPMTLVEHGHDSPKG